MPVGDSAKFILTIPTEHIMTCFTFSQDNPVPGGTLRYQVVLYGTLPDISADFKKEEFEKIFCWWGLVL